MANKNLLITHENFELCGVTLKVDLDSPELIQKNEEIEDILFKYFGKYDNSIQEVEIENMPMICPVILCTIKSNVFGIESLIEIARMGVYEICTKINKEKLTGVHNF